MKKYLFFLFLYLFSLPLFSDILYDSAFLEIRDPPKASRALLYSMLIPSGGQVYNKSYTKALFFLYLDVLCIERIALNNKKMSKIDMTSKETTYDEKHRYEKLYERRQNYYGWLVFSVLYSMLDAYVDAKLYDYDNRKDKIRMHFEQDKLSVSYTF